MANASGVFDYVDLRTFLLFKNWMKENEDIMEFATPTLAWKDKNMQFMSEDENLACVLYFDELNAKYAGWNLDPHTNSITHSGPHGDSSLHTQQDLDDRMEFSEFPSRWMDSALRAMDFETAIGATMDTSKIDQQLQDIPIFRNFCGIHTRPEDRKTTPDFSDGSRCAFPTCTAASVGVARLRRAACTMVNNKGEKKTWDAITDDDLGPAGESFMERGRLVVGGSLDVGFHTARGQIMGVCAIVDMTPSGIQSLPMLTCLDEWGKMFALDTVKDPYRRTTDDAAFVRFLKNGRVPDRSGVVAALDDLHDFSHRLLTEPEVIGQRRVLAFRKLTPARRRDMAEAWSEMRGSRGSGFTYTPPTLANSRVKSARALAYDPTANAILGGEDMGKAWIQRGAQEDRLLLAARHHSLMDGDVDSRMKIAAGTRALTLKDEAERLDTEELLVAEKVAEAQAKVVENEKNPTPRPSAQDMQVAKQISDVSAQIFATEQTTNARKRPIEEDAATRQERKDIEEMVREVKRRKKLLLQSNHSKKMEASATEKAGKLAAKAKAAEAKRQKKEQETATRKAEKDEKTEIDRLDAAHLGAKRLTKPDLVKLRIFDISTMSEDGAVLRFAELLDRIMLLQTMVTRASAFEEDMGSTNLNRIHDAALMYAQKLTLYNALETKRKEDKKAARAHSDHVAQTMGFLPGYRRSLEKENLEADRRTKQANEAQRPRLIGDVDESFINDKGEVVSLPEWQPVQLTQAELALFKKHTKVNTAYNTRISNQVQLALSCEKNYEQGNLKQALHECEEMSATRLAGLQKKATNFMKTIWSACSAILVELSTALKLELSQTGVDYYIDVSEDEARNPYPRGTMRKAEINQKFGKREFPCVGKKDPYKGYLFKDGAMASAVLKTKQTVHPDGTTHTERDLTPGHCFTHVPDNKTKAYIESLEDQQMDTQAPVAAMFRSLCI
tara:strand:+ start:1284 stop:4148 length:2865 start_codon:yes stop_codon:yes gene_type:complete